MLPTERTEIFDCSVTTEQVFNMLPIASIPEQSSVAVTAIPILNFSDTPQAAAYQVMNVVSERTTHDGQASSHNIETACLQETCCLGESFSCILKPIYQLFCKCTYLDKSSEYSYASVSSHRFTRFAQP